MKNWVRFYVRFESGLREVNIKMTRFLPALTHAVNLSTSTKRAARKLKISLGWQPAAQGLVHNPTFPLKANFSARHLLRKDGWFSAEASQSFHSCHLMISKSLFGHCRKREVHATCFSLIKILVNAFMFRSWTVVAVGVFVQPTRNMPRTQSNRGSVNIKSWVRKKYHVSKEPQWQKP